MQEPLMQPRTSTTDVPHSSKSSSAERYIARGVVSPPAIRVFFHALCASDPAHTRPSSAALEVSFHHLLNFARKYQVVFELQKKEDVILVDIEKQTEQVLKRMFEEATEMRNTEAGPHAAANGAVTSASSSSSSTSSTTTLGLPHFHSIFHYRTRLHQSPNGSVKEYVHTSRFRREWIRLLKLVVKQPFEHLEEHDDENNEQISTTATTASISPRKDRSPIYTMAELEQLHSARSLHTKLSARSGSPSKGAYHPTITLNQIPTARTAGESYQFMQPRVRVSEIGRKQSEMRQRREERVKEDQRKEEERKVKENPRKQKMKELLERMNDMETTNNNIGDDEDEETKESTEASPINIMRLDNNDEVLLNDTASEIYLDGSYSRDDEEEGDGAYDMNDSTNSLNSHHHNNHTSSSKSFLSSTSSKPLSFISFGTREVYEQEKEEEKARSERREYVQPQKKKEKKKGQEEEKETNDDEEDDNDFLARLMQLRGVTSSTQQLSSSTPAPLSSLIPSQPMSSRVSAAQYSVRKSYSTSGQYKAHLHPASSVKKMRRWVNADAPERNADTVDRISKTERTKINEIRYDEQGAPIRTERRHAMTERRMQADGVVPTFSSSFDATNTFSSSTESEALDPSTARLKSLASKHSPEEEDPDPVAALIAPFGDFGRVGIGREENQQDNSSTARSSHRSITTRSVPNTSRPSARERTTARIAALAAAATKDKDTVASYDWHGMSSRGSDDNASSADSSRPSFTLHFPVITPQDERVYASQTLSNDPSASNRFHLHSSPTIENGGITLLSQLKPGLGTYDKIRLLEQNNMKLYSQRGGTSSQTEADYTLLSSRTAQSRALLESLLRQQKLNDSRPSFRMDFNRDREGDEVSAEAIIRKEYDVITRDGGLTTAESSEKYRLAQLGFKLVTSRAATEAQAYADLHAHTRGKIVHTGHMAVGSHRVSHFKPFSALIDANDLDPLRRDPRFQYKRIEQSEHEALLLDLGHERQLKEEQEKERKRAEFAKLKPSERRKLHAEAEREKRKHEFPFRRLEV